MRAVTSPIAKIDGQVVRLSSSTTTAPRSATSTPAVSSPRPWVRGTRPIANRTRSTVAGSWLLMWTVRQPSSFLSTRSNCASKRNSSPFIRLICNSRSRSAIS